MVVYWDGRVVLCCADMFGTSGVGSLKDRSIAEVWNGPVMGAIRRKMIARRRFDIPLCRDCDIHLSWHHLKDDYDPSGRHFDDKFL